MDTRARIRLLTADDNFWEQQNPTLLLGEVGFRNVESDDPLMRVGDGVRKWIDLPDMNKVGPIGPQGEVGPIGPVGPEGPRGPPGQEHDPWTAPFTVNDPGGTLMFRLNANRNIEFGGCITVTPIGCAVGINIMSGAATALYADGFVNVGPRFEVMGPGSPPLAITADGSGRLGVNPISSAHLAWDSAKFTFLSAGGARWPDASYVTNSTVEMWGDGVGRSAFECHKRGGTFNYYAAYIFNETPAGAGAGSCNGLRIEAGWVRQDEALRIASALEQNGVGTNTHFTLFSVRGDGLVIARLPASGMSSQLTWNANDSGIYRVSSARRYKTNIRSVAREQARELVRRLRPVTFNSLCPDDDPTRPIYGLIAEEVADIDPALVSYDKDGRPDSVQYDRALLALLPLLREMLGLDEPDEAAAAG